jgi:hypothetical protein
MIGRMIETHATATDFRNNFATIANAVGFRQDRCVVKRHGKVVVALVSYEDLEFLRKHKPRHPGPDAPESASPKNGWRQHFPTPPLEETEPNGAVEEIDWETYEFDDPRDMGLEATKEIYLACRHRTERAFRDWIPRARHYLWCMNVELPEEKNSS